MNTKIKLALKTIALSLTALLIVTTATYAVGTLTPSGTAGDDTQYSLNDIYSKLVDFTDTPTATSSPFATPGTLSASFNTLSDIYALLESEEVDLVPENIADGVEIFGVEGILATSTEIQWSESESETTFVGANSFCATLNENGTGWRLPTYGELAKGLSDFYLLNSENVFGGEEQYYWTNQIDTAPYTFVLKWQDSLLTFSLENSNSAYVKCVR